MTLRLKVDRSTLEGHERALVEKLFFNGRTETTTDLVRKHYRVQGFNPAEVIAPELKAAVDGILPAGRSARGFAAARAIMLTLGLGMVLVKWQQGYTGAFALIAAMAILTGIGWFAGHQFRMYLDWGRRRALTCLTPALAIAVGAALYLWFRAVAVELQPLTVVGVVAIALACIGSSVHALSSRRHREARGVPQDLDRGPRLLHRRAPQGAAGAARRVVSVAAGIRAWQAGGRLVHQTSIGPDDLARWRERFVFILVFVLVVGGAVDRLQWRRIGWGRRRGFMAGSRQRHGRQRIATVLEQIERLEQQRFKRRRLIGRWRRGRLVGGRCRDRAGERWSCGDAERSLQ